LDDEAAYYLEILVDSLLPACRHAVPWGVVFGCFMVYVIIDGIAVP